MGRFRILLFLLLAPSLPARASEIPGAVVVLDAVSASPGPPGSVPPRFVLLEDGQVFVGGTRQVATGRLERDDVKELEKRIARVRKLPGLPSSVSFGGSAPGRWRLRLAKGGQPLDLELSGDPGSAASNLRPLASLLQDLAAFNHPSLHPFEPATYALRAQEGTQEGGCRSWSFGVPLGEALAAPRGVPAAAAADWPTGGALASVCAGEKHYLVSLRPLLPGEKP